LAGERMHFLGAGAICAGVGMAATAERLCLLV
jgi:hypothetical protein